MTFCWQIRIPDSLLNIKGNLKNSWTFVQKINFDFPRKVVELFWVKTRENAAVLDFLAVDNFDFTRKIVKKMLGEKLVKMLGDLHFLVVDNFDFPRNL